MSRTAKLDTLEIVFEQRKGHSEAFYLLRTISSTYKLSKQLCEWKLKRFHTVTLKLLKQDRVTANQSLATPSHMPDLTNSNWGADEILA